MKILQASRRFAIAALVVIAVFAQQGIADAQVVPPERVEICLLVDVTGSARSVVTNLKSQADAIANYTTSVDSAAFGLATFKDYPQAPFGGSSDYPYQLETPLTDAAGWTDAIDGLPSANGGADGPEAQLDAIWGAVNGLDGWGDPCGFSSGATDTAVIVIATTDNGCHQPDPSGSDPHIHGTDEVASTLASNGVTFIGLAVGASARSCFEPLADASGGVVKTMDSRGIDISAQIGAALNELFGLTPAVGPCDDETLTVSPQGGDVINLTNAATCRYLDGDGPRYRGVQRAWNVDTSPEDTWDTGWRLTDNSDGTWSLLNRRRTRYLDADGAFASPVAFNVGQSVTVAADDLWEFVDQGDGSVALRNVSLNRYLAQSTTDKNVITVGTVTEAAKWFVSEARSR